MHSSRQGQSIPCRGSELCFSLSCSEGAPSLTIPQLPQQIITRQGLETTVRFSTSLSEISAFFASFQSVQAPLASCPCLKKRCVKTQCTLLKSSQAWCGVCTVKKTYFGNGPECRAHSPTPFCRPRYLKLGSFLGQKGKGAVPHTEAGL